VQQCQYCTLGYYNDPKNNNKATEIPDTALNTGHETPSRELATSWMYYTNGTAYGQLIRVWNVWFANAYKHWIEVGHKQRMPPNSNCHLYPTIYDSNTQCKQPTKGCWYGLISNCSLYCDCVFNCCISSHRTQRERAQSMFCRIC
jgi:hypothetical protein